MKNKIVFAIALIAAIVMPFSFVGASHSSAPIPTATTGSATSVTSIGATLSGTYSSPSNGGTLFVWFDYSGLHGLYTSGLTWQTNGYLSAFYTLIGIHLFHVAIALLWTVVLLIQLCLQGTTQTMKTRFTCLGLFWGFVNILWVVIFTIVYLMGGVPHV